MKRAKYAGVIVAMLFMLAGCNKCYRCDFGIDGMRDFCSKDFPDRTAGLKMTIKDYEKQGIKCTPQ